MLGGGIAGILAAAALSRAGFEVIIVERDRLPSRPGPRPGTPHGNQLHNLLGRAQLHIEELLPGFHDELRAAGGTGAEVSTQTHVWELGTVMPERHLGLWIWSAPQPLIEHVARRLLLREPVTVRQGTRAVGLRISDDGRRVTGVRVSQDGRTDDIAADVVVDAMGANSPGTAWLAESGCQVPAVMTHLSRQWYSSLVVRRPPAWKGKVDYWLIFPTFPHARAGMVSPSGDEEWYVSLCGVASDRPPRSAAEFTDFAASLETTTIHDLLADATPVSKPRLFGKPATTWKRYDLLDAPVAGLLPIGDALASLSPLLGQGISVAAWEAALLRDLLAQGPWADQMTGAYLAAAAAACQTAWTLVTLFNPPPDSDAPRIDAAGWRSVVAAVDGDVSAHRRYVRMWHLLEPASILRDFLQRPEETT